MDFPGDLEPCPERWVPVEKVGYGGHRAPAERGRRGHIIPHLGSVVSFPWVYPRRLSISLGKTAIPEG